MPAPINVGNEDQVKDGGIGVDALAVFGGAYVQNDVTAGSFLYDSDARLKTDVALLTDAIVKSAQRAGRVVRVGKRRARGPKGHRGRRAGS